MVLSPGSRLGRYEIVAPIGAGGMGEVYRATDTRLERTVAVKVLPEHLSSPEGRQRFEREARTISQLSHPHICALYDVGNQDGVEYLVMEYLEGETLSERLAKGPLPLDQALSRGIEIADALDRAHRQGIIHRDLKPTNVMLTKSGVKLLDFGLAKLVAPSSSSGVAGLSMLPTTPKASNLTAEGTILGTFQYMAPEQLEGKEADARSDIFALGAVLYEMTTGRKAFSGASQASLIGAILKDEPALISSIHPMSPLALDRVVETCLAKAPDDRWQSAHDVAAELKWIAESGVSGKPAATTSAGGREKLAWALLATTATAAALLAIVRLPGKRAEAFPVRFQVAAPEGATFNVLGRDAGPVVVSPDGSRLTFVATTVEGHKLLFVRPLGSLSAQPLAGTEGASYPFWSPDSRFIGFFAEGKLKKIEAMGGPAQVLADAPLGRGGAWNRDGVILFAPGAYDPLYRVSVAGGAAKQVTRIVETKREFSHRWPQFLPDGRHFIYLKWGTVPGPARTEDAVLVGSLDSEESTLLFQANSRCAYAPPGYLFYIRDETLLAVPFDAARRMITGTPVPLVEHVLYYPNTGSGAFSVSDNGVLAYQAGAKPVVSELGWYDRKGERIGAVAAPGDYEDPRISPDGGRVAVNRIDPSTGTANIWLLAIGGESAGRFTFSSSFDHYAVWSPDGGRIAFDTNRNGPTDIYLKAVSSVADEEPLLQSSEAKSPTDWSPDGRALVYERLDPKTKSDLWLLPLEGDRTPVPLVHTESNEVDGRISPDGRWIAYSSDDSGRSEVYVSAFPKPGGRWQVSSGGGSQPVWRRDGKEIFYLGADRKLMAAPVTPGPRFEAGPSRALFQTRSRYTGNYAYDVSPDGQRFLVNTLVGSEAMPPVTVVLHWNAK
jgi:Tol biopolymer transport system component/predicted Ser/Thr protein kinase